MNIDVKHNIILREGTWDKLVLNEVWADPYKVPDLNKDSIVVDVGAHIGCFSIFAAEKGAGSVFAFEACYDNYRILLKNLRSYFSNNKGKKMHCFNRAVWKTGSTCITVPFEKCSVVENTGGGMIIDEHTEDAYPVANLSLDEIYDVYITEKDNLNPTIDVLKLDCEGSEFPILYTTKILSKIKYITMEYHNVFRYRETPDDLPEYNHKELVLYLEDSGFNCKTVRHGNSILGMLYAFNEGFEGYKRW